MQTALTAAQHERYEEALVAYSRLMRIDVSHSMTREELFEEEIIRVKRGWKARIHLALGTTVEGAVRSSKGAARESARAAAMDPLIRMVHYVALDAARRAGFPAP
jgi:hypothetical protein